MPLLHLPPCSDPLSSQILRAYIILTHIFNGATQALQTRSDPTCIQYHQSTIQSQVIPILRALETVARQSEFSLEWVLECTAHFGILLWQLDDAQKTLARKWVEHENISIWFFIIIILVILWLLAMLSLLRLFIQAIMDHLAKNLISLYYKQQWLLDIISQSPNFLGWLAFIGIPFAPTWRSIKSTTSIHPSLMMTWICW